MKPFKAPQKIVKINISLNFFSLAGIGTRRVTGLNFYGRYIFSQNLFLQSKITRISSDRDYLRKQNAQFILELNCRNKLRKNFDHDFSKKNRVVCFFSKFSSK